MLPKWHVLIGFVLSYLLVYFFNVPFFAGVIFFLSSWLIIDLDHYLFYIFQKKDLNFFRFYSRSLIGRQEYLKLLPAEKSKIPKKVYIFHGVESWIILLLLSFFYSPLIWVLLGFALHMITDWIELIALHEKIYPKLSQSYTLIQNKQRFNLARLS